MIGMFVGNLHWEVSLNGGRVTTLTLLLLLCVIHSKISPGEVFLVYVNLSQMIFLPSPKWFSELDNHVITIPLIS